MRPFSSELHNFYRGVLGNSISPDPVVTTEILSFLHRALSPYHKPFFRRAEALSSFLGQPPTPAAAEIPIWLANVMQSAAQSAFSHWNKISAEFAIRFEYLVDGGLLEGRPSWPLTLEVGDSDLHEGGKFTLTIVTGDGQRVVHKSRPRAAEALLASLVHPLFPSGVLAVPQSQDACEGMWQQHIPSTPFVPSQQAFYDCGRFIAFCQLVGLVDLHPTNLVTTENRIHIVDGETVFHPLDADAIKKVQIDGERVSVAFTPLSTSLLPAWSHDPGTGKPKLEPAFIGLLAAKALANGADLQILTTRLNAGYQDFIESLNASVESLRKKICGGPPLEVRRIHRSSAAYSLLVTQAVANCLKSTSLELGSELRRLLLISASSVSSDIELTALMSGDVPKASVLIVSAEIGAIVGQNAAMLQRHREFNSMAIRRAMTSLFWSAEEGVSALAEKSLYKLSRPSGRHLTVL